MLRQLELPSDLPGKLLLSVMPGRYESIDTFYENCRAVAVDEVVCLAEHEEIRYKSPDYAAVVEQGSFPVPRTCFPIPDYDVPSDTTALVACGQNVVNRLKEGKHIVIHCAAGYGRTGLFAVLVLCLAGVRRDEALRTVQAARSRPETPEQMSLLASLFPI